MCDAEWRDRSKMRKKEGQGGRERRKEKGETVEKRGDEQGTLFRRLNSITQQGAHSQPIYIKLGVLIGCDGKSVQTPPFSYRPPLSFHAAVRSKVTAGEKSTVRDTKRTVSVRKNEEST